MIQCLDCGSKNLMRYTEEVKSYHQKITSKDTISKQKILLSHDKLEPDHISCLDCGERFDFDVEDNGKITLKRFRRY